MAKKHNLFKEIPVNYSSFSSIIWGFLKTRKIVLFQTWALETPGSRSRDLKASYSSLGYNQISATILAHCPGDDVIKE